MANESLVPSTPSTPLTPLTPLPRFAAVGAGRMGRGIAIAFAYAGHRISLIDLRQRSDEAWHRLCDEASAEIEGALGGSPNSASSMRRRFGPLPHAWSS